MKIEKQTKKDSFKRLEFENLDLKRKKKNNKPQRGAEYKSSRYR